MNYQNLSEEDTKQRLITPALKYAGWPNHLIWMEYSLRADKNKIVPEKNTTIKIPQKKSRNSPDYLLCRNVRFPLAVIEAKKWSVDIRDGIDQARAYAQLLDLPFAYASNGKGFIEYNLVTNEQRELKLEEFPSPETLWKKWCEARGVELERRKVLSDALYYTTNDGKIPRYYQLVAINKVVNAIVADHRRRALLVMATGTGKTFTAFQIVWRLKQAGIVKNVLYLADRNHLVDQTIVDDFAPFERILTKIQGGEIDSNHQIYFGLYQQLKGHEDGGGESTFADHYRQVPPDFFDLIVVDECHRGSAREESNWREILDYFESAIQIGMTATPKREIGADNIEYFGKPLYVYSLKQGIEDGFLAPFQVVRVYLDKDRDGWQPEVGEVDDNGRLIPDRLYTLDDFDRNLVLKQRTRAVAQKITEYLKHIGRMSKTIVFCTTQRHAAEMRDALRACNKDMMGLYPNYCVRMTGDDEEGRKLYREFASVNEKTPVLVTTSKLLTTGANTKCVELIVLDSPIRSMTEFKQIIGRGTRLVEEAGKTFFTIMDFRGACELFSDPDFDGEPDNEAEWGEEDPLPKSTSRSTKNNTKEKTKNGKDSESEGKETEEVNSTDPELGEPYEVSHASVEVVGTSVRYLDENGKLVTAKFIDYTRRNILQLYQSEENFWEVWNGTPEKKVIFLELAKRGVDIDLLRKELKNPDADEFDLICEVAFGRAPMTREMRASRAKRSQFLEKYQNVAREVLEILINIYAREGIREVEDIAVLKSLEFRRLGGLKVVHAFGGKSEYRSALKDLENAIYARSLRPNANYNVINN